MGVSYSEKDETVYLFHREYFEGTIDNEIFMNLKRNPFVNSTAGKNENNGRQTDKAPFELADHLVTLLQINTVSSV